MKTHFFVPDITCAACAARIEKILHHVPGVQSVAVRFSDRNVEVEYNSAQITPVQVRDRLAMAGYTTSDLPMASPESEATSRRFEQRLKRQIGECLISAGEMVPVVRPWMMDLGLRTRKEWFGDRVVSIQLPSGQRFKMASASKNYLSFQLFWRGAEFYEPITTMVVQELAKNAETFVDVGAHVGFFTLVMASTRPKTRIISFEPNPNNSALLRSNLAANGFNHVTVEQAAVSDADGTAMLHIADSDMSASLQSDFAYHQNPPVAVRTVSLDSYFQRNPIIGKAVFKIDVEGHEAAVFAGARNVISKLKPDIITEVAVTHRRSPAAHLRDIGYRFYQITDHGFLESDGLQPYIRGNLLFLNYLLSARPVEELDAIYDSLKERIREIDLTRTSKYVDSEHILRARSPVTDEPIPQKGANVMAI